MPHCNKKPISFLITTDCGMGCKYCYTKKLRKRSESISLDFAKLGIDTYIKKGDHAHVRFYGAGEPTNRIDIIKDIYNHAYLKSDKNITTEIQTNGMFSKETLSWISKHIDIIWLSWDGVHDIQDYYRPYKDGSKSSLTIEKNAMHLLNHGKGMVGARATIGMKNIKRQVEMVEYFYNIGIKNIWSDPIFTPIGNWKSLNENIDLIIYAKEFIKAKHRADELGIFYGSILTCNFDDKTEYNCRTCLPTPHLTTDGYVSACDMAMFGNNPGSMEVFIYGKFDKKNNVIIHDENKIKNLRNRRGINLEKCKNCDALYHCAGYCLGEVVNETGSLYGNKASVCEPIRFLFNELKHTDCSYKFPHP